MVVLENPQSRVKLFHGKTRQPPARQTFIAWFRAASSQNFRLKIGKLQPGLQKFKKISSFILDRVLYKIYVKTNLKKKETGMHSSNSRLESYQNPAYPPYERSIGWLSMSSFVLGGINLILFTYATLLGAVGGVGILLCMIGALIAWALLPVYKEILLIYPNMIGGPLLPVFYILKDAVPVFVTLLNFAYILTVSPCISLAAMGLANNLIPILPFEIGVEILATAIILFGGLLLYLGIRTIAYATIPFAIISIILGLVSGVLPLLPGGGFNFEHAINFDIIAPVETPFGIFSAIMAGFFIVAFGAPAFDIGMAVVGYMKNPKRDLTLTIYATVFISFLYYIALPFIWYGTLGKDALSGEDFTAVLTPTFAQTGSWAEGLARTFCLSNMFVTMMAALSSATRGLGQSAEFKIAPSIFAKRNFADVQWVALLLNIVAGIYLTWIGSPDWLLSSTNFDYSICLLLGGTFLLFARKWFPNLPSLYKTPYFFIILAALSGTFWLLSCIFGYQQYGFFSVVIGIIMFYAGLIFYFTSDPKEGVFRDIWRNRKSLNLKLNAAFFIILGIDASGYLIAINYMEASETTLMITDIFIVASMLTLGIGLMLPSQVVKVISDISSNAQTLASTTMYDLSQSIIALGKGEFIQGSADKLHIQPVQVFQNDEIGELAKKYNVLQFQIDDSIKGYFEAQKSLENSLDQLNDLHGELENKVEERTAELANENEKLNTTLVYLEKTQDHLVQSQKMVMLANLIANISHQISIPISNSIGSFKTMSSDLSSFKDRIQQKLTKTDMSTFFNTLKDTLNDILSSLQKTAGLIKNFKEVSADNVSESYREFDVKRYIEQVVDNLRPLYSPDEIEFNMDVPSGYMIYSQPGIFFQLLSLMTEYSTQMIFKENEKHRISIKVEPKFHDQFVLKFQAEGKTLSDKEIHELFKGYLLKTSTDIEMKMGLLYSLVISKLEGKIVVSNIQQGGVQFDLEFPIEKKPDND